MRIFGWMLFVTTIVGCGGGNGGTKPPQLVFTSLAVSPAAPTLVDGDEQQLTATPRDQNGNPIAGLPSATFTVVSGASTASVTAAGLVTAVAAGTAMIRASLTSGGITKTADVTISVTALQTSAGVVASGSANTFTPSTVKIASGGTVTWTFEAGIAHNVIFDGPQPPGGNIPGALMNTTAGRDFPAANTYPYHCGIHGASMSGTVIVRNP